MARKGKADAKATKQDATVPKLTKPEVYSGTAAEYFVAGELLRRGVNAFLSIGAHKQIDVLVKSASGRLYTIDVKAVHGPKPRPNRKTQASWNMPKVEARRGTPDFFYVLVWMGERHGHYAPAEYFVMSAEWAGARCAASHATWAAEGEGRDATSPMRRLYYSEVTEWRDRWDLIGVAAGLGVAPPVA